MEGLLQLAGRHRAAVLPASLSAHLKRRVMIPTFAKRSRALVQSSGKDPASDGVEEPAWGCCAGDGEINALCKARGISGKLGHRWCWAMLVAALPAPCRPRGGLGAKNHGTHAFPSTRKPSPAFQGEGQPQARGGFVARRAGGADGAAQAIYPRRGLAGLEPVPAASTLLFAAEPCAQ